MTNSESVSNYRRNRKELLVYLMGGKCSICGYDRCIAALEFHHIDKETKSYAIGQKGTCHNLERDIEEVKKCALVCANCHREIEYLNIPCQNTFDEEKYHKYLKEKEEVSEARVTCPKCGAKKSPQAMLCSKCAHETARQCERPSRDELKSLIRNNSFLKIGEKFNVTDNAVRKWCESYNLPKRKRDINKISDEEWVNL